MIMYNNYLEVVQKSKEAKLKLQQDFCVKLIQYWKAGRELVFVDEVSKKPDSPGWPCACSFTNFLWLYFRRLATPGTTRTYGCG